MSNQGENGSNVQMNTCPGFSNPNMGLNNLEISNDSNNNLYLKNYVQEDQEVKLNKTNFDKIKVSIQENRQKAITNTLRINDVENTTNSILNYLSNDNGQNVKDFPKDKDINEFLPKKVSIDELAPILIDLEKRLKELENSKKLPNGQNREEPKKNNSNDL